MAMSNHTPPVKMPVLFVGHGSPMNAIESNAFTRALEKLGRDLNGRPVGVTVASDGALLVSDDGGNVIYRISYRK
jgi:glucose/arabinose dehydrogenase